MDSPKKSKNSLAYKEESSMIVNAVRSFGAEFTAYDIAKYRLEKGLVSEDDKKSLKTGNKYESRSSLKTIYTKTYRHMMKMQEEGVIKFIGYRASRNAPLAKKVFRLVKP